MIKIHRRWRQTHDMKANKCLSPGGLPATFQSQILANPIWEIIQISTILRTGEFSHFHKNIALIARQCSTNDWNCTNCEVVNNNTTDFNIYFLSSNNGRRYYYFLHINTSTIITTTKYRQWYGNDRALYISWSASMMRTGQNTGPQTWFTNQSSCDWCKS